jgi:uncharacterized protein
MKFEWDPTKAAQNLLKHGVSFEGARAAFNDLFAVHREDRDNSTGEQRYQLLGEALGQLLAISYTERGDNVRIISARKASKAERAAYRAQGGR